MDKNIDTSKEKICKNCLHGGFLVFSGIGVGGVCKLKEKIVCGRPAFFGVNPTDTCDKFKYKR